ncbi:hypothetical protein F4782DRAFT_200710 [Xylaria castorea]|nr:hypothetical protein F4782DRAFT_200710 [Xylaria castorea]
MLALRLLWTQIRSAPIIYHVFLTLLISFCICPSHAHILSKSETRPRLREETPGINQAGRNGENFPRDFATALGVAVVVVTIGTTLICVFAHCWRQILDWGWGDSRSVARKRKRKDEEAWFCGTDRGLPMPQFDILESESQPLASSMQPPERDWDPEAVYSYYVPATHARNAVPGARTRSKARWNNSGTTLPTWLDPDEIERPASVAYLLDRP